MKLRSKIEVMTGLTIASLMVAVGSLAYVAVTKENRVILVQVDEASGARLITEEDEALIKSQQKSLIRRMVSKLYNYDEQNFNSNISLAGDLMSDHVWSSAVPDFKNIQARIKGSGLVQAAEIKRISRLEEDAYRVELLLTVKDKLMSRQASVQAEFRLGRRKRDEVNPFGWEVVEYDETILSAAR